jgi:F0F1-type ATP synthase assembly protein I
VLGSRRPRPGRGAPVWSSPALGLVGIGSYLAVSIAGMAIVGSLLDRRFDTDPLLTLVFLVLGLLVGFLGAYRQLRRVLQSTAEGDRRKGR